MEQTSQQQGEDKQSKHFNSMKVKSDVVKLL